MIVSHNLENPKRVGSLITSTIVDTDGKKLDNYNAASLKSTITWPDPASYNEPETADVQKLADARYDVVNRAKLFEIAIGSPSSALSEYVSSQGETNLLIASPFGNWRDYGVNGFCQISDRILLECPDQISKVGGGVTYSVSSLKDTVEGSDVVKTISNVANAVNTAAESFSAVTGKDLTGGANTKGDFISRWQNMPIYDPAKTTGQDIESLSFTFRFGQGQLFSGEEEVVKPILALANIFLPHTNGDNHKLTGPFMSGVRAKGKFLTAFLNEGLKEIFSNLKNTDGATVAEAGADGISGLVSGVNKITEAVYNVQDVVAKEALSETSTIIGTIGGYVFGPLVTTNVKGDFDFSQVDEYGYRCAGTIVFGGLKPIMLLTSGDVFRRWGYNTTKITPDGSPSQPALKQLKNSGAGTWVSSKMTDLAKDVGQFIENRRNN